MKTTVLANNKQEFREGLKNLKMMQKCIFSPDEVDYLTDCDNFEYVELIQEEESDEEFIRLFSTWLHERPKQKGHVDYYVLLFLPKGKRLLSVQVEHMERYVAECFDTSHGWLLEVNHRERLHLRIRLICSYKNNFHRLTRKTLHR